MNVQHNPAAFQQPLTVLDEDEQLFRDAVAEFAERQVRSLGREMDEHAKIPRALIDKLFALGVMGIEIPDEFDGSHNRRWQSGGGEAEEPGAGDGRIRRRASGTR